MYGNNSYDTVVYRKEGMRLWQH